jgi:hypothetical protein
VYHLCGTAPYESAYSCAGAACGDDVLRQDRWQYCTGASADCGAGNLVWHGVEVGTDCAAGQLCQSDASSAWCYTCPEGCSGGQCSTCGVAGANVAPAATASMSAGGSGAFGPTSLNDGLLQSNCQYAWITTGTSLGGSAYLQYNWSSAQTLWGMWIDTEPSSGSGCLGAAGRGLEGGDVQWWNGSSWVTDGTVTGQTGDWSWQFGSPVTTTAVRIYRAYSYTANNALVFEWEVYACP